MYYYRSPAYYKGLEASRGIKVYRGVQNIRNQISEAAVNHPSRSVLEFCGVPINRYFTTTTVPGLRTYWSLTDVLKSKYDIKNPMDLVEYLRDIVRGRCGRLRVNVMASILSDFLEDVCSANDLQVKRKSNNSASICIAIMESKLPWTKTRSPRVCS